MHDISDKLIKKAIPGWLGPVEVVEETQSLKISPLPPKYKAVAKLELFQTMFLHATRGNQIII